MNPLIQLTAAFVFLIFAPHAAAATPQAHIVKLTDPAHSIGVRIGDVLQREVQIAVEAPYQLSKSTLPVKGSNFNGIELKDIQLTSKEKSGTTLYTLKLDYQVFRASATPAVMELPEEELAMTGGQQALALKVPAWRFRFSPLVTGRIETAMRNVQPQQTPALIDTTLHTVLLSASVFMLLTGIAFLLYINADAKWLPFMGGAFAQAHRNVSRLHKKQDNAKLAFAYLHHAFNTVHGENLFAKDVDIFVERHPGFRRMKLEIDAFFARSNHALFGQHGISAGATQDLLALSRRLRDCERGI